MIRKLAITLAAAGMMLLGLGLLSGAGAQDSQRYEYETGLIVQSGIWCVGRDAARGLSAAIAEDGLDGYNEHIRDPEVKCTDHRLFPGSTVLVLMVVEHEWTAVAPDGVEVRFWRARLPTGHQFYLWDVAGPDGTDT